jgi:hypothetical protein
MAHNVVFVDGITTYPTGVYTAAFQKNWAAAFGGTSGNRDVSDASGNIRFPGTKVFAFGPFTGTSTTYNTMTSRTFGPMSDGVTVGWAQRSASIELVAGVGFTDGIYVSLFGPDRIQIRNQSNSILADVPHPGITSVFNYYELELVTVHPSNGEANLYVNGVLWRNFTGIPTGTTIEQIQIRMQNGVGANRFTDFYVAEAQLGDSRVITLLPDGDGTHTGLTPEPTAANYTRVNSNNDTTYNHSDVPGTKDTYTVGDMPFDDVSVYAVAVSPRAQKVDAGSGSGRALVRTGATDFHGDDMILAAGSWQWYPTIWSENPDTLLPWETTEVDDLEVGFEVR